MHEEVRSTHMDEKCLSSVKVHVYFTTLDNESVGSLSKYYSADCDLLSSMEHSVVHYFLFFKKNIGPSRLL